MKIVGIAGSLRRKSYNAALLRAAVERAPADMELVTASIAGIPLYNADVDREQGVPEVVANLKDLIAGSDGLLLVTPEYNNSMPGVFKNAIDWLSRPSSDIKRVFGGKPVAMIGASTGMGGTRLSQMAWLPVLRVLGTRPWYDKLLYVTGAAKVFDDDGKLVDEKIQQLLGELLEARFEYEDELIEKLHDAHSEQLA